MASLRSGKSIAPTSDSKKIQKRKSRAAPSPAAGPTPAAASPTADRTPAAGRTSAVCRTLIARRTPEASSSSAAATAQPISHQDKELNKVLEGFRTKYIAEVVKRIVSIHPDLIDRVRELADVDPGPRNVIVTNIDVDTKADTLISYFGQYGGIEKCTTHIGYYFYQPKLAAYILFKDRSGARKALRSPYKDINGSMIFCALNSIFENIDNDNEYDEAYPNPMEDSEEEEEEEPVEKLIEYFKKPNLFVIVREAVAKYPHLVLTISEVADVDPDFRLIVVDNLVCSTSNKHFSTFATKLYSVFGQYGEIQHCTYIPGRAYILFRQRMAATEALKQPFKEVGDDNVICEFIRNLPCTPTHVKVGTPVFLATGPEPGAARTSTEDLS